MTGHSPLSDFLRKAACLVALLCLPVPASAEEGWDFYVYTGVQGAFDSDVFVRDEVGATYDFTAGWDGNSFEMPPYWGVRVMRNFDGPWSLGVEFTHTKVYANDQTLDDNGFGRLEMTDGLNIVTANAQRTFFEQGRWTGRGGVGLGLAVPHVEVTTPGGTDTFGYQVTGPAARWYIGADYALTDRWTAFAEYGGTYSMNSAELSGGGRIETDIITNAVNVGLGFSF